MKDSYENNHKRLVSVDGKWMFEIRHRDGTITLSPAKEDEDGNTGKDDPGLSQGS